MTVKQEDVRNMKMKKSPRAFEEGGGRRRGGIYSFLILNYGYIYNDLPS